VIIEIGDDAMFDIQPVLDKLKSLSMFQGKWHVNPELILNPHGDGAVVLRDSLENVTIAAVDFESGDDILAAIDRLAEKASSTTTA
jgi:hypothetical protein